MLRLSKAKSSDTEAPFLDLNLSKTNGIISSKIYHKRDYFNFEKVNFPLLDEEFFQFLRHNTELKPVLTYPGKVCLM